MSGGFVGVVLTVVGLEVPEEFEARLALAAALAAASFACEHPFSSS